MDATKDPDEQPADTSSACPAGTNFLHGGGKMGALIRAHDWTSTLGPPARWPQSLRTVVRLMLTTQYPVYILWGPESVCLYNDSCIRFADADMHPRMLGARAAEVWCAIWDVAYPQIQKVMSGHGSTWNEDECVPLVRDGALEERFWTTSYSPIDDDDAPNNVGGVLVICSETTHKMLVQRHQAFRLQLEAVLRAQSTSAQMASTSTQMLGEFLQASCCGYADIDAVTQQMTVRSEWTDGTRASLPACVQLSEFGPSFLAWHRHGQAIWVEDPAAAVTTGNAKDLFCDSSKAQTGLAAPLVKNGRLVAVLFVYPAAHSLRWTEQHRTLIRDVAERTFEAVEHARAAAERDQAMTALRDSETRYRSLVEACSAIVWEMPASGEIATPQPGWSAYTGQSFAELKGWGWLNAIHPEDQDLTTETLGRAFEAKSNYTLRYRLRAGNDEYRPMLVRAVTVMNADGTLRGWIATHSDLSA